ncbi:hypothetical protein BC1_00013 [Bacillus phage BC-1]|nr:hypothetical protein BC1_00013 [Bacillus phage BC-1]
MYNHLDEMTAKMNFEGDKKMTTDIKKRTG